MNRLDQRPGWDGAPDDDHEVATIIRGTRVDVPTDVERLVATSLRIGARIRRRRRLAVAACSVTGVAALVGATLWTTGLNASDAPIGPASVPSASSSAAGADDPCTSGAGRPAAASAPRAVTPPPPDGPCLDTASPRQELPVRLGPAGQRAGWTCTPPADEKFTCLRGDASVVVNLRDARLHRAYTSDPSKQTSASTYVGAVHGDHFVTLDAVTGTPDLAAVADHLIWEDPS